MTEEAGLSIVGDTPFMAASEIEFFSRLIRSAKVYLEFGSGASTGFALNTDVRRIVSVESDAQWLDRMRRDNRIQQACVSDRLHLIHVDIGAVQKWGFPADPDTKSRWANYPEAPWPHLERLGDDPDLILVDGRFRVACCLRSVIWWAEKGRTHDLTILLHDVTEKRPSYQDVYEWCDPKGHDASLHAFTPKIDLDLARLKLAYARACLKPI